MTDEVKEILDDLRKTADNTIFVVCSNQEELDKMPKYTANFLSINDRKAKLLFDYITNLQEENKKYQNDYENLLILGLKQETHFKIKCEDLQQRINKAVEYIKWNLDKNEELIEYFNYDANFNELLKILRGDE